MKRGPEELKKVAPKVAYEWHMFDWAYDQLLNAGREEHLHDGPPVDVDAGNSDSTIHDEVTACSLDNLSRDDAPMIGAAASSGFSVPSLNASLETFLLHARVLRDFLTMSRRGKSYEDKSSRALSGCKAKKNRGGPRKDDVLAEDYLEDEPDSYRASLGEKSYLAKNGDRLSKSLAHISYLRCEYESSDDKEWEVTKIYEELSELWKKFITQLPLDRRPWFDLPQFPKPDHDEWNK